MVTRRCREENSEEIKDVRVDLIWVVAVVRPEHGRWQNRKVGRRRCEVRGAKRGQGFEDGATASIYLLVDSSCEMDIVGNIEKSAEWKKRGECCFGRWTGWLANQANIRHTTRLCTFHLALDCSQTGRTN